MCAGTLREVRPGDLIIKVNEVSGNAAHMLEECGKDYLVTLTLKRGSSLNAEAPEFVPGTPWIGEPAKRMTLCDSTKAIQKRVEAELARVARARYFLNHFV